MEKKEELNKSSGFDTIIKNVDMKQLVGINTVSGEEWVVEMFFQHTESEVRILVFTNVLPQRIRENEPDSNFIDGGSQVFIYVKRLNGSWL